MLRAATNEIANGIVLTLDGELDIATAATLEMELTRLSARRPKVVVIDMRAVPFVGSLGMGMLLGYARGVIRSGGVVRLAALEPAVRAAFERACLQDLIPLDASVEASLEQVSLASS